MPRSTKPNSKSHWSPAAIAAAPAAAEDDAGRRVSPHAPGRRKGPAPAREWLIISASGRSQLEEAGKQTIMRRTGLPARDLRVLGPSLSYHSAILGRERAIVINLEHIRAIVTATEVLIPNSRDPVVTPFIQDLQSRMVSVSSSPSPTKAAESNNKDLEAAKRAYPEHSQSNKPSPGVSHQDRGSLQALISSKEVQDGSPSPKMQPERNESTKLLPFEFRVLEVCLESACRRLELETSTLEKEAYPALDELTSKVSTLNLERVRLIKSHLVAISGRAQKVRDELEHLLNDDTDMAAMHLTEKLVYHAASGSSRRYDLDNIAIELDEESDEESKDEIESSNGSVGAFRPDIDELEMLLEAYFVQIEGILNKLNTLREYVDDTEDYINIMLDDKQNQLLQMGVMISTATLIFTVGLLVTGVLAINIHIPLFESSYIKFWEATAGLMGGSVLLYIIAILWGRKSGLLQF